MLFRALAAVAAAAAVASAAILALEASDAAASVAISLSITPMFRASVIMFPASSASISKELLVQNYSGRQNVHGFGEEEQADG